jgi:hypothetical protein
MRPKLLSSRHSVHSCSPDYTAVTAHLQDDAGCTVCNLSNSSAEGLNPTASLPCFHCDVQRGCFSPKVYRPEHCGVYRGHFLLKIKRPERETDKAHTLAAKVLRRALLLSVPLYGMVLLQKGNTTITFTFTMHKLCMYS